MLFETMSAIAILLMIFYVLAGIFVVITLYQQGKKKQPVWFTFTILFSIITAILWWMFGRKKR